MSEIGVKYGDSYAVTETFQLLKIPWEWYDPSREYGVVIARKEDVPGFHGTLADLTDLFGRIRGLLNEGAMHLRSPSVDLWLDEIRTVLKGHTTLVEIPPSPWGHPYMAALTHDVDRVSVRQSPWRSAVVAAARCFLAPDIGAGLRILIAKIGIGKDPWTIFGKWRELEAGMGVRSTFFFLPPFTRRCLRGYHPYREISYTVDRGELGALRDGGWEVGVHGMNWDDAGAVREEKAHFPGAAGNRTHWLLHDRESWGILDAAGYAYDSTFGYDDDAGYRAGTTQVFQPEGAAKLLELPLHIQDMGLFGASCWALDSGAWVKVPCLHLTEAGAREFVQRFFPHLKKHGGVLTLLWHYEDLLPPRTWMMGTYRHLVAAAQADGAWVTTAGNVVEWFRLRRETRIGYTVKGKTITISVEEPPRAGHIPAQRVRVHLDPSRVERIDGGFVKGEDFVDIRCKPEMTVVLK